MAFSQTDLSQEVTSMTVDELREVLDDVVNHQKPKSEKCSLVRRLTEEASKDELSLEPHGHFLHSATGNNSRRKFPGSTPSSMTPSSMTASSMTAQSLGLSGQASNSSSQSLQDLASELGPTSNSLKSCPSGTKTQMLNKAMRANSFSLASNSTQTVCEASQTRSSSASGAGTWTLQTSASGPGSWTLQTSSSASGPGSWTSQTSKQKEKKTNSNNSNISTRTLSSSATSFNSDYSDPLTLNSSYVDVNDKNNNNDCDREQVAEGGASGDDSSTKQPHASSSSSSASSTKQPHASSSSSSSASSLKTYSHHSSYLLEDSQKESKPVFRDDQQLFENAIEMQDFRRQAKYVQYNSSNTVTDSGDTVDSLLQFSDLTTREPEDPHFARRIHIDSGDGPNTSLDQRDRQMIRTDDSTTRNVTNVPSTNPVNNKLSKKKAKPDEPKVLAQDIEGYIGDKDVEFLVHYVAGSDSTNSSKSSNSNAKVPASSAPGNSRKKEKQQPVNGREGRKRTVTDGTSITNGCLEEESREGSPVEGERRRGEEGERRRGEEGEESNGSGGKLNKYPFTKSESLDSPAVSPSQAASIASCVEYGRGREFSEDEMGYHSDREGGFVPYTRRKKVRGQKSFTNKTRSVGTSSFPSAASSPLSTPSVISASSISAQGPGSGTTCLGYESELGSGTTCLGYESERGSGTTCRGYESEREYCTEDRKPSVTRRKVVSSMPHSEQNSPENSDVDSSLSLPVAHHRNAGSRDAVQKEGRETVQKGNRETIQKVSYAKMAAAPAISSNSKLPDMVTFELPLSLPAILPNTVSTTVENITTATCNSIKHPHSDHSHQLLQKSTNNADSDFKSLPSNSSLLTPHLSLSKSTSQQPSTSSSITNDFRKDSDYASRDSDHVRKDSDHIKKDSDHFRKDSDHIKKDSDHVRKDSELRMGRNLSKVASITSDEQMVLSNDGCKKNPDDDSCKKNPDDDSCKKNPDDDSNEGQEVVMDLPPVIMFGEQSETIVQEQPVSASFTFGFFDDIPPTIVPDALTVSPFSPVSYNTSYASEPVVKVDNKKLSGSSSSLVVEVKSERKMVYKSSGPDVDTNSFNYSEIICYIQNAWESATRNFESLNNTKSGSKKESSGMTMVES